MAEKKGVGHAYNVDFLNGTLTNAAGDILATVIDQPTTTTVVDAVAQQGCDILNLDLGPLHAPGELPLVQELIGQNL